MREGESSIEKSACNICRHICLKNNVVDPTRLLASLHSASVDSSLTELVERQIRILTTQVRFPVGTYKNSSQPEMK